MRRYIFIISLFAAIFGTTLHAAGPLTFESQYNTIEVTPDKTTGLDKIFVVRQPGKYRVSFTADNSTDKPRWYRYSNLGGGFAEELRNITYDGSVSYCTDLEGDMGYIIETSNKRYYYWVVDYSLHSFSIDGVTVNEDSDCMTDILDVSANGSPIHYYSINGRQNVLSRDIEVKYQTLIWDDENKNYVQNEATKILESVESKIVITPASYCATVFTVSGDRFLRQWGLEEAASSSTYYPLAVDCHTFATQPETEEKSNQISTGNSGLGGSAPAEIKFTAYTTDAVIHNEWQISRDIEFEDILYRFIQQDIEHTFRDEGTYYVRFIGSNSDGSCEAYGDTYTVEIGNSELKCPNAFSPGASEGINDEWKVSYRSLIEFECWIFDRYGTEMFHFNDPSKGWDGKYKGKLVNPGVYYYVIKAKGADGKKYKKSGDINIIRFKGRFGSGSGGGEPTTE